MRTKKRILGLLVGLLILSLVLPCAMALADGPKIPVPPKELPGKWPIPQIPQIKFPEGTPMTLPERDGDASLTHDPGEGVWFMWNFYWVYIIGTNYHYGECGPFGDQWHHNVYVKRSPHDPNESSLLRVYLGYMYQYGRYCRFIYERNTGFTLNLCDWMPNFDWLWSRCKEMLDQTAGYLSFLNWYIAWGVALIICWMLGIPVPAYW